MNAIMISMKAEDVKLIASGRKRAHVLKTRPHFIDTPFKVYIYENTGRLKHRSNIAFSRYEHDGCGAVIGECICHEIRASDDPCILDHMNILGMKAREFSDYLGGKTGYVFYFSSVKIYDQPQTLGMFGKNKPPQSWYHIDGGERRAYDTERKAD